MSNRGNFDYYKIAGTQTEDRDIAGRAHRSYSLQRSGDREAAAGPASGKRSAGPASRKRSDEPASRKRSDERVSAPMRDKQSVNRARARKQPRVAGPSDGRAPIGRTARRRLASSDRRFATLHGVGAVAMWATRRLLIRTQRSLRLPATMLLRIAGPDEPDADAG